MRHNKRFLLLITGLCAALAAILGLFVYAKRHLFVVLQPKGTIADSERSLIIFATVLSLFVVVPVLVGAFVIAWRYREDNPKAVHAPDWDGNKTLEALWWGIPCLIILVLAIVTWTSSHQLDPYKPITASKSPMTIQVVALQWRWLFIYPEQGIATVNYVRFPEQTPINFQITADAPMNSFWIPQLGGQVYAMSGMQTQLHLMANSTGHYQGSSANLSGSGFADMKFTAESVSDANFDAWVRQVKTSPSERLTPDTYQALAQPTREQKQLQYASTTPGLYDTVMEKYMAPSPAADDSSTPAGAMMQGMNHGTYSH